MPESTRAGVRMQVVQFVKSPEYAHFSRIVFDTAPTGHTLRLLTLPDFLDASLGATARPVQSRKGIMVLVCTGALVPGANMGRV